MCRLLSRRPDYDFRRGMVYRTDELGECALYLSDFVEAVKLTNQLARKWVAEANQPTRIDTLKAVEG